MVSSKSFVINFTVNFWETVSDRYEGLDTYIFEWKTLLAADKGREPNKNKPSTYDQKYNKKRNLHIDDGSQGSVQGKQGCA